LLLAVFTALDDQPVMRGTYRDNFSQLGIVSRNGMTQILGLAPGKYAVTEITACGDLIGASIIVGVAASEDPTVLP
jgi:hypothetical protein